VVYLKSGNRTVGKRGTIKGASKWLGIAEKLIGRLRQKRDHNKPADKADAAVAAVAVLADCVLDLL
jgi:hypothetical protein